jgi:hypothetical protein
MSESQLFFLALFVGVLGPVITFGLFYLGWRLFRLEVERLYDVRLCLELHARASHGGSEGAQILTAILDEYLSRRNEFWTTFGQLGVSVLVVVVLTVLLLARVISAEAGLPILAGVGGFAIGKGAQAGRMLFPGRPPERPQ